MEAQSQHSIVLCMASGSSAIPFLRISEDLRLELELSKGRRTVDRRRAQTEMVGATVPGVPRLAYRGALDRHWHTLVAQQHGSTQPITPPADPISHFESGGAP